MHSFKRFNKWMCLLVFQLCAFAGISSAQPTLNSELISEARVVVGVGECRTLRKAVYQNKGFIEIEIDRPYSGRCAFGSLALVLDGIAIEGPSAVSGGIVSKNNRTYEWSDTKGRLLFAYDKPLSKELVEAKEPVRFGLIGLQCGNNCMTEVALAQANVQSLIREGKVRETIVQNGYEPVFARYQEFKDARLLEVLLKQIEKDDTVDRALTIYAVAKDGKALAAANQLALQNKTVANLMKVYAIDKQRDTLKVAYEVASTPEDKRVVELAVMQSIQDKLFDFKVSMAGTGKTSSKDSDVLVARIIQSNVTSTLTYAGTLKTDVFTPTQDYLVDTIVTLTVKGKINGKRNCGILWMASCDINNEDASRTHEYAVPMRFTRASKFKAAGKTDIDWKSVSGGSGMASGLIMGGTVIFSATGAFDIQVKVKSISLIN
jgi:hypothetical protein